LFAVATRVLRPRWAVLWAAFFNFIAFMFFGTKVTNTVGQTVKPMAPTMPRRPWVIAALLVATGHLQASGDKLPIPLWVVLAAATGAAVAPFGSTALGAPVSTTHTVAGAVTGVGTVTRGVPVNWTVFGQMALAWLVTIPAAALAALAALAVVGLGLAVALWVGLQRTARSRHFEPDQLPADRAAAPAAS
jgi:phosphate/sulfate permease